VRTELELSTRCDREPHVGFWRIDPDKRMKSGGMNAGIELDTHSVALSPFTKENKIPERRKAITKRRWHPNVASYINYLLCMTRGRYMKT